MFNQVFPEDRVLFVPWEEQCNGTIATDINQTLEIMPDLTKTLENFNIQVPGDFLYDVKVHMLMPNQYPCIPNWHQDFIPRDSNGDKNYTRITPEEKMYMIISGPPYTEVMGRGKLCSGMWYSFNQTDVHRGTMAKGFGWRGFIRATPKSIYPKGALKNAGIRRHSQVYLDSNNFTW